jgi:AcrR family transcriptional regulator
MVERKARLSAYNVATPGRLLDAAEALFATRSYETVTLREIAEMAGTAVSQIVYHFGQKDELIREVIIRRAGILTKERVQLLDGYEQLVGAQSVTLEPLVRAFITPYFKRLSGTDDGWRNYAQFIGRSVWDGKISPALAEGFNPAAERYIKAFRRALPGLSEAGSLRAFQFMLAGIYASTTNDPRISSLSGNAALVADFDGYQNALIPFVVGGIERMTKVAAPAAVGE